MLVDEFVGRARVKGSVMRERKVENVMICIIEVFLYFLSFFLSFFLLVDGMIV